MVRQRQEEQQECPRAVLADRQRQQIRQMRVAVGHVTCGGELTRQNRAEAQMLVGRNPLQNGLTWWGCESTTWDGACVHAPGHAGEHDHWCL